MEEKMVLEEKALKFLALQDELAVINKEMAKLMDIVDCKSFVIANDDGGFIMVDKDYSGVHIKKTISCREIEKQIIMKKLSN